MSIEKSLSGPLSPLEERVGPSWAESKIIQDLFSSKAVRDIAKKVSEERKVKIVFPTQENVFRAFRATPLSTVRVVWIAQD